MPSMTIPPNVRYSGSDPGRDRSQLTIERVAQGQPDGGVTNVGHQLTGHVAHANFF